MELLSDDPAAWMRGLLVRYEGPLTSYATRIVGDVHLARDVVQETFLKLLRQDRAAVEPIAARWLFAVCRNGAIDERRKGRHMTQAGTAALSERSTTAPTAGETTERRDDLVRALQAIGALPEGQQEVLRLKFSHGLSYQEIAEVTGLSVSHVGVKLHEGMRALRARLGVAHGGVR